MEEYTVFVPMMLFGWIPITVLAFWVLKAQHAVIFSVIGGWLFLPMAVYDLPGFPEYGKESAISFGLILGSILSDHRKDASFTWKVYDLPILVWCFCPLATSLLNGLGLWDGFSSMLNNIVVYAVPYLIGRLFFNSKDDLRALCIGIIIGGILYLPLCIYEIRMSPQLHDIFYGYFQHRFEQHIRYGGYRPIVFMEHGLMVSLWMATVTIVTLWYWQTSKHIEKPSFRVEMLILFLLFFVTTILCKSANGWAILLLGISCYMVYRNLHTVVFFHLLITVIPLYFIMRMSGVLPTEDIASIARQVLDEERVSSLIARLTQEDLVSQEILKRPWFGWGGFGRGLPVDPNTGEIILYVRDALWLITFQTNGIIGLLSLYLTLLVGPLRILGKARRLIKTAPTYGLSLAVLLSLAIVYYCIDSLFNSMHSILYITIVGALISYNFEVYSNGENEFDVSDVPPSPTPDST